MCAVCGGTIGVILLHLAHQAMDRFVVMSPFIDAGGAANLLALFQATSSAVRRVLIARCPDGVVPIALQPLLPQLAKLHVAIYNYWLPRPGGGYETFHAKVGAVPTVGWPILAPPT